MFDPGLKIGQILRNENIVHIFKCGNMGGMRRSRATDTLVLISDYTKGLYHDKWIGGVLHYTGMGKNGDQDINWSQNATLAACGKNGVDVHLFEVMDAGEYVYCGRIELVDKPYIDTQLGEDHVNRRVWMFPIRPVPDNDVKKPAMFVFKDKADYQTRGKNVDAEYARLLAKRKSSRSQPSKPVIPAPVEPPVPPKPAVVVPPEILGKQVRHRSFGMGNIIEISNGNIKIMFEDDSVGIKNLSYEICMKNGLIKIV